MLVEIYCNEFSQKTIKFKEGLNVVLGTNIGDNSIGKSTFMLIIDFVFGGDDYTNAKDILRNVKDHSIFFKFEFDIFINNNSALSVSDVDINYLTKDDHKMTLYWYCYSIADKLTELYPKCHFSISIKLVSMVCSE